MKRDKVYLKKVVYKDMEEEDYYHKTDKKSKISKLKTNQIRQSKNKKDWNNGESEWN
jgi:hypothetical protein